jgi:hypothetical protein
MIAISMLLVAAGFLALLLGVLNIEVAGVAPLTFVYAAIVACLLAGLFLALGVLRSRPRPRTADGPPPAASWSGATARVDEHRPEAEPAPPEAAPPWLRGVADTADPPAPEAGEPSGGRSDVEARLRTVPGIGPARLHALLEHFGGPERLVTAGVDDLAAVQGVSRELAGRIHEALHRPAAER